MEILDISPKTIDEIETSNRRDRWYYFIYCVWCFMENIAVTNFRSILGVPINVIDEIVSYFVLFSLVIFIILRVRFNMIQLLTVVLSSLVIVIVTIRSGNNHMISLWLFIVASKNVDIHKVFSITIRVVLVVLLLTTVSSVVGIIPDYLYYRGDLVRHAMGYGHVNVLGMKVFQLVVYYTMLFYRTGEGMRRLYLIIIVSALFVYMVPNSITPVILLSVLFVLLFIWNSIQVNRVAMTIFMNALVLGATMTNAFSLYFCMREFQNKGFFGVMNRFLSSRFSLSHIAYKDLGITIWGQRAYISNIERMKAGLHGGYFLDNTYMILLVRYGVIFFCAFSCIYILAMVRLTRKGMFIVTIVYFIYAVYGLMEPSMYRFAYNTTLVFLSIVFYGDVIWSHDSHQSRIPFKVMFKMPIRVITR